jgi:hypothetical protein
VVVHLIQPLTAQAVLAAVALVVAVQQLLE